jgi:hypothetical protein
MHLAGLLKSAIKGIPHGTVTSEIGFRPEYLQDLNSATLPMSSSPDARAIIAS